MPFCQGFFSTCAKYVGPESFWPSATRWYVVVAVTYGDRRCRGGIRSGAHHRFSPSPIENPWEKIDTNFFVSCNAPVAWVLVHSQSCNLPDTLAWPKNKRNSQENGIRPLCCVARVGLIFTSCWVCFYLLKIKLQKVARILVAFLDREQVILT